MLYDFALFRKCCADTPDKVFVDRDALRDASDIFSLRTKAALLDFIGNGGLEDLKYEATALWKNNPTSLPLMTDSYEFKSMFMLGYIAIIYSHKTGNWIIKSFHLSKNRSQAMVLALKKAGLITKGDKP